MIAVNWITFTYSTNTQTNQNNPQIYKRNVICSPFTITWTEVRVCVCVSVCEADSIESVWHGSFSLCRVRQKVLCWKRGASTQVFHHGSVWRGQWSVCARWPQRTDRYCGRNHTPLLKSQRAMFKKMSDVVSTQAEKCRVVVCEFNLCVRGAPGREDWGLVPHSINNVLHLCLCLCLPTSLSSCPSELQRGQVNLMQISTSVVWCNDVVVNIHFFSFLTIFPIVAMLCYDLLDLSSVHGRFYPRIKLSLKLKMFQSF